MADPAEQLVAGQTGTQETTVSWEDSSVGEGNTYLTGVIVVVVVCVNASQTFSCH